MLRRVISFIYQNFYPSDRVPLSNPFTADVLIQQRTQLKRHMFGNWFSFSFFFSQLSLLVIFYYFLLTWLWFFWGDLICLPVLRFYKTFSCWHPCRVKEQRTSHHTSYSTHKIIMYSIIMNGLFQCQILTNHRPINVHPTFLLVYRWSNPVTYSKFQNILNNFDTGWSIHEYFRIIWTHFVHLQELSSLFNDFYFEHLETFQSILNQFARK